MPNEELDRSGERGFYVRATKHLLDLCKKYQINVSRVCRLALLEEVSKKIGIGALNQLKQKGKKDG